MPRTPTDFLETFARVTRALTAVATQAYATADVGSTQAKFLRRISGSGTSQADLARATGTDPTLTSRVLQALVQRALVKRERSATDRREYVLTLTASGKRVRERVEKLRTQIATRVVSQLDARDLEDFERIAGKMLAALAHD